MTFTANTNTITSVGQDLSGYDFGTVFEVEGSSKNDGRYIVSSALEDTIIVEGYPLISELGLPSSVDADAIKINSGTFNYTDVEFSGDNISAGVYPYETSCGTAGIFTILPTSGTNSNLDLLDDTSVFKIEGSKYNDGVFYVNDSYARLNNGTKVVNSISQLIPEDFDSNVTITSRSISTGAITSRPDFYDFLDGNTFILVW